MPDSNTLHFGIYTPYERTAATPRSYTRTSVKRDLLNSRLADAQKSGHHTDVSFTFQDSTDEVSAHRLVLALSSCVFDTMFYSNTWSTEDKVEIVDINPSVFRTFIEYLYSTSLPKYLSIPHAIEVLYTARKYCVEELESILKQYLSDSITLETVLPILKTSIMFDYPSVASKCWECIEIDTDRVVHTKEFISLDLETVGRLLERDSLTIPEVKLFDAVQRWAVAECKRQGIESNSSNRRAVLGDTVRKIRFPVMDATEFADGPAISGLLNQEEISNSLLTKFGTFGKPPQLFSPKKREPKKHLVTLVCKCRSFKIVCSFCQDRDGSVPTGTTREASSSNLLQTPMSYCCCRTRDYCPSRNIV